MDSGALVIDTRVRQVECLVYERRPEEALALADQPDAQLVGAIPLSPSP